MDCLPYRGSLYLIFIKFIIIILLNLFIQLLKLLTNNYYLPTVRRPRKKAQRTDVKNPKSKTIVLKHAIPVQYWHCLFWTKTMWGAVELFYIFARNIKNQS